MKNEEVTTANAMASHAVSDGKSPKIRPDGHALGAAFFTVDANTFSKARLSRAKGKRWHTLLGKTPVVDSIRGYARQNKNPNILLRNASDGSFMYAQRGI